MESGERIGFVTTMLLAMTVFLLLIPSFLPETSDGVPILGVGLQVTLALMALVLFTNIFVLKIFFMDGTPPKWVQRCFSCNKMKGKNAQRIHVTSTDELPMPSIKSRTSMNAIELSASSRSATSPQGWDEKHEEITWQKVSVKLDHAFFLLFSLVGVASLCAIYLGHL